MGALRHRGHRRSRRRCGPLPFPACFNRAAHWRSAVVLRRCRYARKQFTPLIAQWLIDGYGWRQAFLWMGLGWGSVVLILLLPFFFDARDDQRAPSASTATSRAVLSGLTLAEGVRDPALLRIAAALFITSFLGVAVTVHKVPILTQTGLSREVAAQIAASAGIAGVTGKLLTGWMMDRWQSGWIGGICLSLPALACLLLLDPIRTPTLIVASMMIFGYSAGAYLQICTYLTTRYGGLRHFGKIFGIMAGPHGARDRRRVHRGGRAIRPLRRTTPRCCSPAFPSDCSVAGWSPDSGLSRRGNPLISRAEAACRAVSKARPD